eukprot:m.85254 g.85254  ORF g.85254 m.85254 type:complete len:2570 (-) comp8236_c0_seq1:250-7959(-)
MATAVKKERTKKVTKKAESVADTEAPSFDKPAPFALDVGQQAPSTYVAPAPEAIAAVPAAPASEIGPQEHAAVAPVGIDLGTNLAQQESSTDDAVPTHAGESTVPTAAPGSLAAALPVHMAAVKGGGVAAVAPAWMPVHEEPTHAPVLEQVTPLEANAELVRSQQAVLEQQRAQQEQLQERLRQQRIYQESIAEQQALIEQRLQESRAHMLEQQRLEREQQERTQAMMAPPRAAHAMVAPPHAAQAPMGMPPAIMQAVPLVQPAVQLPMAQAAATEFSIDRVPLVYHIPTALSEEALGAYYHNPLLLEQPARVSRFFHDVSEAPRHPLHDLLTKYVTARESAGRADTTAKAAATNVGKLSEQIWRFQTSFVEASGRCADDKQVYARQEQSVAQYAEEIVPALIAEMQALNVANFVTLVDTRFHCQLYRQKIEDFIVESIGRCCTAAGIQPHTPLTGVTMNTYISQEHYDQIQALRACVNVLFLFIRRDYTDTSVRFEIVQWLERCTTVTIALGTADAAHDVINHLVRGVHGMGDEWAKLLQFTPNFSPAAVDVAMALLCTLLSPAAPLPGASTPPLLSPASKEWSVVDVDLGEVTPEHHNNTLGESDCIVLLKQFPLRSMMLVVLEEIRGTPDNPSLPAVESILRLFAFMNAFFRLLCSTLADPVRNRHHHYVQHISRTVQQCLNLLTSHWRSMIAEFRAAHAAPDVVIHLQAEYDSLIIRVVGRLLDTRKMGCCLFLPHICFEALSLPAAWRLVAALLQANDPIADGSDPYFAWQAQMGHAGVRDRICNRLGQSPDEGVFVLTTLAEVAKGRLLRGPAMSSLDRLSEERLVRAIATEIFYIGAVHKVSSETLFKNAGSLLGTVAEAHSIVHSVVLQVLDEHIAELSAASPQYFLGELPYKGWCPGDADMAIVQRWLRRPLASRESLAGRKVASLLNYGFIRELPDSGHMPVMFPIGLPPTVPLTSLAGLDRPLDQLHLAVDLRFQLSLALTVVEAHSLLCPQNDSTYFQLPSTQARKDVEAFTHFAWEILYRLSLHLLPDYDIGHTAGLDVLIRNEFQPLAAYVILAIGRTGRDPALFATEGVQLMQRLLQTGASPAVLHILHHNVPRFLHDFQGIVSALPLISLLQMLLVGDSVKALSELFGGSQITKAEATTRLQQIIIRHVRADPDQPHASFTARSHAATRSLQAVDFWLTAFSNIPDWNSHASIRACAETALRMVADVDGSFTVIHQRLGHVYDSLAITTHKHSTIFSIFKRPQMVSLVGEPAEHTLSYLMKLLKNEETSQSPVNPYLGFHSLCLEMIREAPIREKIGKLFYASPTMKAEDLCSKAGTDINRMAILRWLKFVLSLDADHPLAALCWQVFMALFFESVRIGDAVAGRVVYRSFGQAFFSGKAGMIDKISQRLQAVASVHQAKMAESGAPPHHRALVAIYAAMHKWINDPRLRRTEIAVDIQTLPEDYDVPRFVSLFNAPPLGSASGLQGWLWMDLFIPPFIAACKAEIHAVGHSKWLHIHTESAAATLRPRAKSLRSAHEEAERLQWDCEAGPQTVAPEPVYTAFNIYSLETKAEETLQTMSADLGQLQAAAQRHQEKLVTAAQLADEYMQLLPSLYTNDVVPFPTQGACPGRNGQPCSGPCSLRLDYRQHRANLDIRMRINNNRQKSADLSALRALPDGLVAAVLRLQRLIDALLTLPPLTDKLKHIVQQVGAGMFFRTCRHYVAVVRDYPPADAVVGQSLRRLGEAFVAGHADETETMLDVLRERPDLIEPLGHMFTPLAAPTQFVRLYKKAWMDTTHSLVVEIIRWFDVPGWLSASEPALSERVTFLADILAACHAAATNPLLLRAHRDTLGALLQYRFPELFNDALFKLLSGAKSKTRDVPADLWGDFADLLQSVHGRTPALPSEQAVQAVAFIHSALADVSAASQGDVVEAWLPYLPHMTRFFAILADCISRAPIEFPALFGHVRALIEPFVVVRGSPPVVPFSSAPAHLDAAAAMLAVLTKTVQGARSVPDAMAVMLDYYLRELANAPSHALELYHRVMSTLPLGSTPVPPPVLFGIYGAIYSNNAKKIHSTAVFFARLYAQLDWLPAIDAVAAAERADPHATSLGQYLECAIASVIIMALSQEGQAVDALRPVVAKMAALPLFRVQPPSYDTLAQMLETTSFNPAHIHDNKTAVALCVQLLRVTAEMEGPAASPDSMGALQKQLRFMRTLNTILGRAGEEASRGIIAPYMRAVLEDIAHNADRHRYPEDALAALLTSSLALLNLFPREPLCVDLREALIAFATAFPGHTFPLLVASCRALESLKTMVAVVEYCVDSRFTHNRDLSAANNHGWGDLEVRLAPPDLLYTEFLDVCVMEGAVGTLCTHSFQLLRRATNAKDLESAFASMLKWISNIPAVPARTPMLVLLVAKMLETLTQMRIKAANNVEGQLGNLIDILTRLGEDKVKGEGLLSYLMGAASPYPVPFRLFCRIMAAFGAYQLLEGGAVFRMHDPSLPVPKASRSAEKLIAGLSSAGKSKPYSAHVESITLGLQVINDPTKALYDAPLLIALLVEKLFPREPRLRILTAIIS